jgi:hypothetical protein
MRRGLLIGGILVVLVVDVAIVLGVTRMVRAARRGMADLEPPSHEAAGRVEAIHIGRNATTERDFRQRVLEFNLRTMVDAYQQVGDRSPAWDDTALHVLRGYAAAFARVTDRPTDSALLADANKALAAGCTDPLVLYCCGAALQTSGDEARAGSLLTRSLEGLRKSRYPRIRAGFAALRLANMNEGRGPRRSAATQWQTGRDLLAEAVADGAYRKGEERVLLFHLTEYVEEMPQRECSQLYQQLSAAKNVDPYVAAVFGGKMEVNAAWDARGDDWASEVTEEGWRAFRQHLAKAEELLTEAWQAHPEYPEAPAEMIRVSSGLDGYSEDARMWFDRAIEAEADSYDAYHTLLWFMCPRWGGSHEEMYQFGLECAKTGRFDTETPLWFVRALWEISDDLEGDENEFWLLPQTRKVVREVFDGYASSSLTQVEKQRLQLLHAGAAWYIGDYEEATALFESVTWGGGAAEFDRLYGAFPRTARAESQLFSGPAAADALHAQELLDDEAWQEAAKAYASVISHAGLPASALAIAKERLAKARWHADYESGKWVRLPLGPSLSAWDIDKGKWSVAADGALVGAPQIDGAWIMCQTDLGPRAEFRGTMEFAPAEDADYPAAGVYFAWPDAEEWEFVSFMASIPRQKARLRANQGKRGERFAPAEVRDQNTFAVSLWDNTITASLNGKPVYKGTRFRTDKGEGEVLAGVGSERGGDGAVVRFRDMEVRKLTQRP